MNKSDILLTLEKYNLDRCKQEFIILSGSALVLLGLKDSAKDIDIATSDRLYKELLTNYECTFELKVDNYDVWYVNDIINFSNHFYNEVEYINYNGYKVQTEESIRKIRKKMYCIKKKIGEE